MKLFKFVPLILIVGGFVVGVLARAADDDGSPATSKNSDSNRSNQKSTIGSRQSNQATDRIRLGQELHNLEKELKQLVVPPRSKANQPDEKQEKVQSRIREIQARIQEIRGKPRTSSKQLQTSSLSREQLDAQIDALQQEINKANDAIEMIAEINPNSEELKMLKRRVAQKQRRLNGLMLIAQRKHADDQSKWAQRHQESSSPKTDLRQLEIFTLKHASAEYAAELVHPFLEKGSGVIAFDINTNSIIVKDIPEVLKDIHRILDHIDVVATDK